MAKLKIKWSLASFLFYPSFFIASIFLCFFSRQAKFLVFWTPSLAFILITFFESRKVLPWGYKDPKARKGSLYLFFFMISGMFLFFTYLAFSNIATQTSPFPEPNEYKFRLTSFIYIYYSSFFLALGNHIVPEK